MRDDDRLVAEFETHRQHLRGVAYRMLGSLAEADDAVQEAWLRFDRADAGAVENRRGWLTTVVGRICLDVLRSRTSRREESLDAPHAADIEPAAPADVDPEAATVLAESVGLAMLVVLDALTPAERVAFVLHDMFAVPFDQIAPIVDRSPVATKKLASRARRRVRGNPAVPEADVGRQRRVVEAFIAASRGGDIRGLLAVLDPDVVRRADPALLHTGVPAVLHGAEAVAEETAGNAARARFAVPALVDGTVGVLVAPLGRLMVVLRPTIADGRITEIDVIADRARIDQLRLALLDDASASGPA